VKPTRGFTLIELMIVIVIVGIIAAIAIPDLLSRADRAREAAVKGNMHSLQLAAEDYAVENNGRYSATLDATHVGNRLPNGFANPFSKQQGAGAAWEDRATLSASPSTVAGIVSYADSDTTVYNIKGEGRSGELPLVLSPGR
jgi:prepilin-type N-terminal cleavage/methylation domain-containing protein